MSTIWKHGGRWAVGGLAALVSALAGAQLNDTGITHCADGWDPVTCDEAGMGDGAAAPRQDARFGRDAAAVVGGLRKYGGGAAGFDFTPLDASGRAIALTGLPPVPAATPACVWDHVTGLAWEVKTAANGETGYTYAEALAYAASANTNALCGHAGWRLPSRRELLSIIHRGRELPAIDVDFFPHSSSEAYWSATPDANQAGRNWVVDFGTGVSQFSRAQGEALRVRLVRDTHVP